MLGLAFLVGTLACGQSPTDPDSAGDPTTVEIDASRFQLLVGGNTELTATVRNRHGNLLPAAAVRWSTTDEGKVRVRGKHTSGQDAQVDGEYIGRGTVIAMAGQVSDSVEVTTVDSGAVAGIRIISPTGRVVFGQSVQLQATALDAESGSIRGATFDWSSSDPAIATVSGGGFLEPRSAGRVEITARYADHVHQFDLQVYAPQAVSMPAFPGAEGYGAEALSSCRTRPIVHHLVTNTGDSGVGSLRDIIENRVSPRTYDIVTFATGGTIATWKPLSIQTSCLYIAGQTAPGGGIQLINDPGRIHNTISLPRNGDIHDIVVRYLKVRTGDVDSDKNTGDPVGIRSGINIVFDHCSVQFGNDENFEIMPITYNGQDIRSVSVQWCIISQALGRHSTGVAVGRGEPAAPAVNRIDFHHNLVAQTDHRMPRFAGPGLSNLRWANNVVYDWGDRAGRTDDTTGTMSVDFIRNYYKAGPRNTNTKRYLQHEWRVEGQPPPSVYLDGNIADPYQLDPEADQRQLYRWNSPWDDGPIDGQPMPLRATSLASASVPIQFETARQAYESTLAAAGANRRLDCSGRWVPNRDDLDARVVDDTRNRTGPAVGAIEMTSVDDWGGIPDLSSGTACSDTDDDGMPDEYEKRVNLDWRDPADATVDLDADGYVNLEEYLNGTPPR